VHPLREVPDLLQDRELVLERQDLVDLATLECQIAVSRTSTGFPVAATPP
jgi:hypothetical protein